MEAESRRRIIYSLHLVLEPPEGSQPGASSAIYLLLNRAGMSTASNRKPRIAEATDDRSPRGRLRDG
jgi:hypothetical protein